MGYRYKKDGMDDIIVFLNLQYWVYLLLAALVFIVTEFFMIPNPESSKLLSGLALQIESWRDWGILFLFGLSIISLIRELWGLRGNY